MSKGIGNVVDVVSWRLCLGCGACVHVCPEGALTLVDIEENGLRPKLIPDRCAHCGECLKVCPGIAIEAPDICDGAITSLQAPWGTVLEVWEGYAADPEIRFQGSSGGVATALSLFCLEREGMPGVLHIAPRADDPLRNEAVLSHSRDDLLTRTGSRYAPAAPCSGLPLLKRQTSPYVVVGKPCDIVALRKWQTLSDEHSGMVGLAISIFCAGTPSTRGTQRVLDALAVSPDQVIGIRYRGCGWPGRTTVTTTADGRDERSMSYEQSWGTILSKHTQFRCRICPDSTGELADISCGDPWYRRVEPDDPGRSLVLVRTDVGRAILHAAIKAGYVHLERAEPDILPHSQRSLLQRRQHLWGRLLALRGFRVPVPRYRGFSLFENWRSLPFSEKVRSIFGTVHRIRERKWDRPLGGNNR